MSNLRRPAPQAPSTVAYVSRYKRGHMVEASCAGLGGYHRTAYAHKGTDIYDPEKAYVASSWLYAMGTPEQGATTGRFFRSPAAAKAFIVAEAKKCGFLTADATIAR